MELQLSTLDNAVPSAIAVDISGNVYLAGTTLPHFSPTADAFEPKSGTGFVAKFDPLGALVWASRLTATPAAVATDALGFAYVTGYALDDFVATPGAFRSQVGSGICAAPHNNSLTCPDAFVAKISLDGSRLLYATLLGGFTTDQGVALTVDANGVAYVTGNTDSVDFPVTRDAIRSALNGGQPPASDPYSRVTDVFFTKVNATGSDLLYSTFLGGTSWDVAGGLALDGVGAVYLTGSTGSLDFPVSPGAFPTTINPRNIGSPGFGSGFFLKVDASERVVYASYYSTSQLESSGAVTLDGRGHAFFVHNARTFSDCSAAASIVEIDAGPGTVLAEEGLIGAHANSVTIAPGVNGEILFAASSASAANPFAITPDAAVQSGTALFGIVDFRLSDNFVPVCATNAASLLTFRTSADSGALIVAPGEVVSIFGWGLASAQVSLGDTNLPVLYQDAHQINATVPSSIAAGVSTLSIRTDRGSLTYPAKIAPIFPGIFNLSGYAVVRNEDGTENSQDHPAKLGSVVTFYVTGLGAFDSNGQLSSPFRAALISPASTIVAPLQIASFTEQPGTFGGVFSIRAVLPQSAPTSQTYLEIGYDPPNEPTFAAEQLWVIP